jgi:hypothetical protein
MVFREAHGMDGGEVNESTRVVEESLANIGATVMGRNMFGGHPGAWDAKNAAPAPVDNLQEQYYRFLQIN